MVVLGRAHPLVKHNLDLEARLEGWLGCSGSQEVAWATPHVRVPVAIRLESVNSLYSPCIRVKLRTDQMAQTYSRQ